ncbi:hypothetical protein [Clostridium sp. JS66]|uniref:hypothetical protein n=1 Tax=Clostridium sp. JS66 TaxID=3064705 RepID=UPI00298DAB4A|nr:hypothetical protein [Clostridium sp. JS66]WPC44005.1 hypothetical protein Q6H37_11170 [Clostridium sp. JS66]
MKLNKKSMLVDILILVLPVIIMFLLMPILPDKISIHKGLYDRYIDKKYSFLLGVLPFIVYKLKYNKK